MVEYKESGVKWIGKIPKKWKVKRVKYTTKIPVTDGPHETPNFVDEGVPFYSVDGIQNGKIIYEPCRHISTEDADRFDKKEIPIYGDILMGKAASIGKIAIIDRKMRMQIWSPLAIIRANNKIIDNKFLKYYLLSHSAQIEIDLRSTTNTQKNIAMKDIENINVPVPELKEQKLIANFIDNEVKKMDKILNDLNKQIEVLIKYKKSIITEMVTRGINSNIETKESGIEWIGKIPKSWEISKIRYVVKLRQEKALYSKEKDLYIGLENIEGLTGNYIETDSIYEDGIYDIFRKDDILFNKLRPYLLKIMYAKFDGYCTGELVVIKDTSLYKKYLYYYLYSDGFMKIVDSSTYGTKMPRASWDFIKQLPVLVPSYEEQIQIAKYLDKECIKVDEMIEKKKQQIEKLENYKKSFIYEYVTGKKRVKGE